MSSEDIREINEGLQFQGADEKIAYTLTTTPWSNGTTPTNVDVKVYSVVGTVYTDVTSTVMPIGTPSVASEVITLPPLTALTVNILYRVEIKFTCGGNIWEAYGLIRCKK